MQGSLATWLTVKYNTHGPSSYMNNVAIRDRTRFLVFTSWWTVLGSIIFAGLFFHSSSGSILTSVAAHGILSVPAQPPVAIFCSLVRSLILTWIFWTAGAASITQAIGGGVDCR